MFGSVLKSESAPKHALESVFLLHNLLLPAVFFQSLSYTVLLLLVFLFSDLFVILVVASVLSMVLFFFFLSPLCHA